MGSARGLQMTALVFSAAIVGLAFTGIACYRPTIKEGGFQCNYEAGASHQCPEGFTCELASMTCKKHPSDAGTDRGDGGDGATDGGRDADAGPVCFVPRSGCTPADAGVCDPYCQSGCGCREKCTVNSTGTPLCASVVANPPGALKPCDPSNDTCGPGQVCMNDNCTGRCYQFCRTDADCPGAACSRDAPGGQKVCDVAYVDSCDPTPSSKGGQTGCAANQGCYVASSHPTHTLCDCTGGQTQACTSSRSCLPGLLCVDPNGMGSICLQVCRLATIPNGADCLQSNRSCLPYTGNSPTNPPNATYGYCF